MNRNRSGGRPQHGPMAMMKGERARNFKATMGARETLDWFFQVGWDNNSKPIFKEAKPLPSSD